MPKKPAKRKARKPGILDKSLLVILRKTEEMVTNKRKGQDYYAGDFFDVADWALTALWAMARKKGQLQRHDAGLLVDVLGRWVRVLNQLRRENPALFAASGPTSGRRALDGMMAPLLADEWEGGWPVLLSADPRRKHEAELAVRELLSASGWKTKGKGFSRDDFFNRIVLELLSSQVRNSSQQLTAENWSAIWWPLVRQAFGKHFGNELEKHPLFAAMWEGSKERAAWKEDGFEKGRPVKDLKPESERRNLFRREIMGRVKQALRTLARQVR